jgi:hypothetical protein
MNPDPGQGRQKRSPKKRKKSRGTIFIATIWKFQVREENK